MSLSHPPPNPDPTQRGQSAVPILQLRRPRERTGTPSAGRTLRSHPNPAALSTAQHSAAHPRPHSRKRSAPGPNSSPPPKKKPGPLLGRNDARMRRRPFAPRCAALRIPGAEQRSALLSRISRRGKQILSSAFPPRPDPPAPQLCGHKGVPTAGEPCFVPMGPPGRRGQPGCAPRAAQLPLLAESSTKNQCASLIKPLHSRRALPSRPRAAKAALPPP